MILIAQEDLDDGDPIPAVMTEDTQEVRATGDLAAVKWVASPTIIPFNVFVPRGSVGRVAQLRVGINTMCVISAGASSQPFMPT